MASEEDKFWKFLTKNTNFNKNILDLDTRLLRNYYKSSGFYDVKIIQNLLKLKIGKAKILFYIDEGKRYSIRKISTKWTRFSINNYFFH